MNGNWLIFWVSSLLLPVAGAMSGGEGKPGVTVGKDSYLSGGKKIKVETFVPSDRNRHPAVLVLYGSGGSVVGKGEMTDFAKALAGQGTVVFLVHYFNRTGTLFVAGDDKIVRLSELWTDTVRDGVAYAMGHPRVREGSVGLFGYSLGAYLAVAESARNPRVGVVAELSGGIFGRLRGKLARLPPLLILHGREDERVPVSNAIELEQTARRLGARPQIHIYENEGHRLSKPALADATQRTLRFFDRHLAR